MLQKTFSSFYSWIPTLQQNDEDFKNPSIHVISSAVFTVQLDGEPNASGFG